MNWESDGCPVMVSSIARQSFKWIFFFSLDSKIRPISARARLAQKSKKPMHYLGISGKFQFPN
jgi:hypothetical protein